MGCSHEQKRLRESENGSHGSTRMFGLMSGKSGLRGRSKLKASYDCYQLNPGEDESISMTRHLLNAGRVDEAFRWTRKARSHFPHSARIDKLYRKTRKAKTKVTLSRAQALARREPTATRET